MALENPNTITLFDFERSSDLTNWLIVNDGVMGGMSRGELSLNDEGHALFNGHVSLDNNGGFTSVRYQFPNKSIVNMTYVNLRLKGDGKSYQLRLKARAKEFYSYRAQFKTTGEWEDIIIPLDTMSPTYRGRQLNRPNFSANYLEEIGILVSNKKEENFELLIDKIVLSN